MRKLFCEKLNEIINKDKDAYLLLGGVGYGFFKPGGRIINCEASEQAMIDIAVGLAMEGKKVFVYAITPHLYRAFEGIRIYLNYHKYPVVLIGAGRDRDYGNLGFTHWAEDAKDVFGVFKNIKKYWPESEKDIEPLLRKVLTENNPVFISLKRQ